MGQRPKGQLLIIQWNVGGLTAWKHEELRSRVLEHRHDIIVLTETHAYPADDLAWLTGLGYTIFRADRMARNFQGRGGVLVMVCNRIVSHVQLLGAGSAPRGFESVWIRIKHSCLELNGRSVVLGACYATPQGSTVYGGQPGTGRGRSLKLVFDRIRAQIGKYVSSSYELLLAGDLNARTAGLPADVQDEGHVGAI